MSNNTRDTNIRPPSPSRLLLTFARLLLTISATAIALFSLRYALPHIPAPARLTNVTTSRVALSIHAVSAAIALLAGPWQFVTGIRTRHPHLHRALGRCYALAVLIGWCASLPIALHAQTGPIAAAGFLCLGLCWITTTATAIWKIKHRDIPSHQRWMTRSYAQATAAITLRIYLLIILTQNVPFIPAYRTIAWLCWLPNLLLAEFILIKKQKMHWPISPSTSIISPLVNFRFRLIPQHGDQFVLSKSRKRDPRRQQKPAKNNQQNANTRNTNLRK